MWRWICAISACLVLAGCGGGGGSSGSSGSGASSTTTTSPPTTAPLTNFASLIIDAGPAALNAGPNGYISDNVAFVSVTLCAPGSTTNCQTIDHVQVDTGSVGLRIVQSVLNSSLLSTLPLQTDAQSNPVGECFGYVDGYVFGSVHQADFKIGGESVSNMPFQVIGDAGQFSNAPSSCSSGGGTYLNTVPLLGANGVIGIGSSPTDCGSACTFTGGSAAAIYYDCPASGCGAIIGRTSNTAAPFQQLPNPVAAMSVDNNGVLISLPSAPASGESSMSGTIYFGIGTQTNNALGSATVLTTTTSASSQGAGFFTVNYNGHVLKNGFIDSGSNLYVFSDSAISACTDKNYQYYYCPTSPLTISPTLTGTNGVSANGSFVLNNAAALLNTNYTVLPGVGSNTGQFANDIPNSFDFGLPFFFGRNVYVAIEGRTAGGSVGPFVAF